MKNSRKIYLDMDGVVADFNKFASDFLGREVHWEAKDLNEEEWKRLGAVENMYFKLPLIEGATKLVALAKSFSTRFDVEFLTAIPRVTSVPSAGQDKIDWVNKYFPGMKVNFGPYSRDKQNWARPGYILVDDKRQNVEQWAEKGGIAVYHEGDFETTFKNLITAVDQEDNQAMILGKKRELYFTTI